MLVDCCYAGRAIPEWATPDPRPPAGRSFSGVEAVGVEEQPG
jgi:hypothetical protein